MRLLFELDKKDYNENGTRRFRPSVRAIIWKDGRLAMIHSLKYDYYKFPGGGIEEGEDHFSTLVREVKEEAGLTVIPSTIKEYGLVRRIQKGKEVNEVFVQDNYYYFCDTEEMAGPHNLDAYEDEEKFTLEYVTPDRVINTNRCADHGVKNTDPIYSLMIEREAMVVEMFISEI